eukprot:scaffold18545_cov32-Tisochrysis_lutea.AAC.1
MDLRALVKVTYELEGDRLEILLARRRLEGLLAFGRQLNANADGCMPNVDSLLRSRHKQQARCWIKYLQGVPRARHLLWHNHEHRERRDPINDLPR